MNLVKVSNQTISNTLVRRVGCWEATAKSEGNPHYGSLTPTNRKLEGGLSAECRLSMDLLRGGLPLPSKLRIQMERLFGVDFSTVRWHEGDEAIRLGAVAFTYGEHLYFPKGGFKPDNPTFLAILGHELAHVVQQRFGLTEGFTETVVEDALLENEADVAGCLVAAGQPVSLASILGRTQLHKTVPRIQAIKLSINDIGAGTLLQIIDTQLLRAILRLSGKQFIFIHRLEARYLGNWLNFVGNLNKYEQIVLSLKDKKPSLLPCRIELTLDGSPLQPSQMNVQPDDHTERLYFPETLRYFPNTQTPIFSKKPDQLLDLSYPDIADGFGRIMKGYSDQIIARDMLLIAMGQKPQINYQQYQLDFLAGVVTLMFGMEASRFPSALATSLMILDLIMFGKTYGRTGEKRFTLAGAFDKKYKGGSLSFDLDYLYGGKYPYAVHKPGSGNAGNRRILGQRQGYELLQSMSLLNHRLIVPRREVTLFIHWLEAQTTDNNTLKMDNILSLHELLHNRLNQAYEAGELPKIENFPGSPTTNRNVKFDVKIKPQSLKELKGKEVYFCLTEEQHQHFDRSKKEEQKYFHSTNRCKLIADSASYPDQYESSYARAINKDQLHSRKKYQLFHISLTQQNSVKLHEFGIIPCPHCISPQ